MKQVPEINLDSKGRRLFTLRKEFLAIFNLLLCYRILKEVVVARRSNQSILKEGSPGCSLEGLMLKLKLQYFGYLM